MRQRAGEAIYRKYRKDVIQHLSDATKKTLKDIWRSRAKSIDANSNPEQLSNQDQNANKQVDARVFDQAQYEVEIELSSKPYKAFLQSNTFSNAISEQNKVIAQARQQSESNNNNIAATDSDALVAADNAVLNDAVNAMSLQMGESGSDGKENRSRSKPVPIRVVDSRSSRNRSQSMARPSDNYLVVANTNRVRSHSSEREPHRVRETPPPVPVRTVINQIAVDGPMRHHDSLPLPKVKPAPPQRKPTTVKSDVKFDTIKTANG